MISKIKKYSALFAATLNIAASFLFFDAATKKYSDPDNVNDSIAIWLFAASLALWLTYLLLSIVKRNARKK